MPRMSRTLSIRLRLEGGDFARLRDLQRVFADACSRISFTVRETRCWNRVALHHLVYRELRQSYPQLGSQMACNVIYSVCRAARAVYQHPQSPWVVKVNSNETLPLIKFRDDAPVYFDRHTLSLVDGKLSLYTLDGRMRLQAQLGAEDEQLLRAGRLREIALVLANCGFELQLTTEKVELIDVGGELPNHLLIEEPAVVLLAERQFRPQGRFTSRAAS